MPWVTRSRIGSASEAKRKFRGLGGLRRGLEFEPEERVRRECERIGLRGDGGEGDVAEHLDRNHAGEAGEVERDGLREAGEIGDAEDGFAVAVFLRSGEGRRGSCGCPG